MLADRCRDAAKAIFIPSISFELGFSNQVGTTVIFGTRPARPATYAFECGRTRVVTPSKQTSRRAQGSSMGHPVVLIPGDGIGPEIAEATRNLLDAVEAPIEWRVMQAGSKALAESGTPLPDETLSEIRRARVALKAPIATSVGTGFRSVNVEMRQKLNLYANYRPARSIPGLQSRYENVDLIVVRENTEGLYCGLEQEVAPGIVHSLRVITKPACERIMRFAFETARAGGRRKVTFVHKANILKLGDGLFLKIARQVAENYPDIAFDDCIVDAAAIKLVINPSQFDVLVMENLFGDILSDLTSGLVGGLGVAPSANVGEGGVAIFEAVHGTAPDIAGRGLANPTALMLSACLMLRHLGELTIAETVEEAIYRVIRDGVHLTADLGGAATTSQFTSAVIAALDYSTVGCEGY